MRRCGSAFSIGLSRYQNFIIIQTSKCHIGQLDGKRAEISSIIFTRVLLPRIRGMLFETLGVSFRMIFGLPTRHFLIGPLIDAIGSVFLIISIFLLTFMERIPESVATWIFDSAIVLLFAVEIMYALHMHARTNRAGGATSG